MKTGIVLDANDVKKLIAVHFGVSEDQVIKSQYSYTVITEENECKAKAKEEAGE